MFKMFKNLCALVIVQQIYKLHSCEAFITANGQSPLIFKDVINNYFERGHHSGIMAYLCEYYDFIAMDLNKSIKYEIMETSRYKNNENEFFEVLEYHNMGVFLDLTCTEGTNMLEKLTNKNVFTDLQRWLFWSNSFQKTLRILSNLDMSIDTDAMLLISDIKLRKPSVLIYDVYKVHRTNPIIYHLIGYWHLEENKIVQMERPTRNNFHGFKINVVHVPLDLEVNNTEDALDKHTDMFYEPTSNPIPRYSLSQLLDLRGIYNFSYNYTFVESWGREDKDGYWNGMMGVLQRKEAEFGFAHVYMRRDRKRVCDFRYSFINIKILFVFIQPPMFGTASALTAPFRQDVWIILGLSIIVMSFVIWRILKREEWSESTYAFSTSYVFGCMTQQGIDNYSVKVSGRQITLTLLIYSFFISLYYNAAVLNGLLLPIPSPITNLKKLLESKLDLGAFDEPYFRDLSEDGLWGPRNNKRLILEKRMTSGKHGMYYNGEEGIENLKKENFALLIEEFSYHRNILPTFSETQMCSSQEVKHELPRVICGVAFARQSPYRNLLTTKLIWQDEVGLRKLNADKWNYKFKPECGNHQQSISIGIPGLTVAFEVLLLGLITSVFIFIIEGFLNTNEILKLRRNKKLVQK